MPYSYTEARGTGSSMTVPVVPYLSREHITVYVDGLPTTAFEWINDQTVSLIAPANRLVRVVRRTSPGALLTDYMDGASLPAGVLDLDSKQAFYLAQEALDLAILSGGSTGGTTAPGVELTTAGILALLAGQITPSQLELDLRAQIGLITAPATTPGSLQALLADEAALRGAALINEAQARSAALATEAGNRNAAVNAVKLELEQADLNLAAQVNTVIARADTTNARVGAVETTASALATDLGTVQANYTIKVQARSDGRQAIAGIGLSATASNNLTQSEMVFLADKFTFVPSAADYNAIPQPLLVAGLVNGVNTVVIPPSRYGDKLIEARMIVDGGITARTLAITGGAGMSIWPDTNIQDLSMWSFYIHGTANVRVTVGDGTAGNNAWRNSVPSGGDIGGAVFVPVQPGRRYRVSALVRKSTTANGSLYIRALTATDASGAGRTQLFPGLSTYLNAWTTTAEGLVAGAVAGTFTRYSWELVPSGNTRFIAPLVLLNWGGTAGYMEAQDFRIEEMLDSSLVVQGGLTADRIDTRGLSIKDAAGNVILAAGTQLPVEYASAGLRNDQITAGRNLLSNPAWDMSYDGWTLHGNYLISPAASGFNFGGQWYVYPGGRGNNGYYFQQLGGSTDQAGYWDTGQLVACQPNTRYIISAYTGAHRCNVAIYAQVLDAGGNILQDGAGYANNAGQAQSSALAPLSGWVRISGSFVTPANAAAVKFIFRKGATYAGESNSYLFITKMMLEVSTGGNTTPSPWNDSGAQDGTQVRASNPITAANVSTYIANAAIGNAQIGGDIFSTNFAYNTAGWIIRRDGYAEFSNVKVRGDVQATSLNGQMIGTGNIFGGAVSSGSAATNASAVSFGSASEVPVVTTTVQADPAGFVFASVTGKLTAPSLAAGNTATVRVSLYINGVRQQFDDTTYGNGGTLNQNFALSGFVAGASGTVTVQLTAIRTVGVSGTPSVVAGSVLYAVSQKR